MNEALLPPAILAPLALALCVAGWRWAAASAVGLFLVAAMPAVVVWVLGHSAPEGAAGALDRAGAVVVLSSPGRPFDLVASPTLLRLRRGAALARRTGLPVLVAGEMKASSPFEGAEAMAGSLEGDFGVRARWVMRTDGSVGDAVGLSAAALREAGVRTVVLLASPWERGAATALFRRAGIEAERPAEAPMRPERLGPLEFLPLVSALQDSADAASAFLNPN